MKSEPDDTASSASPPLRPSLRDPPLSCTFSSPPLPAPPLSPTKCFLLLLLCTPMSPPSTALPLSSPGSRHHQPPQTQLHRHPIPTTMIEARSLDPDEEIKARRKLEARIQTKKSMEEARKSTIPDRRSDTLVGEEAASCRLSPLVLAWTH
ncbi:hypothetical protein U1Q18_034756 [Sarracenia purpurea var. burkii]